MQRSEDVAPARARECLGALEGAAAARAAYLARHPDSRSYLDLMDHRDRVRKVGHVLPAVKRLGGGDREGFAFPFPIDDFGFGPQEMEEVGA